jgi:hypothetical protein
MLGLSQKSLKEVIRPMRPVAKRKEIIVAQAITDELATNIANAIALNNKKITEQLVKAGVLKEEDLEGL